MAKILTLILNINRRIVVAYDALVLIFDRHLIGSLTLV
jgi:hypothetical protein